MRFTLNFKPSNKSVRSLLSYSHLTALVAKVPKIKGCRLFSDECDKRGIIQLSICLISQQPQTIQRHEYRRPLMPQNAKGHSDITKKVGD